MADNDESHYAVLKRLDKARAQMLRDYADECAKEKDDYDRNYPIQSQSLRDHNKYMGEKKTLLEPTRYKELVDQKLKAYARELEQEQKSDLQEKQEEKLAQEQKHVNKDEKPIDPRRLAFRERMREMDEQNQRNKDKGRERD